MIIDGVITIDKKRKNLSFVSHIITIIIVLKIIQSWHTGLEGLGVLCCCVV